MGTESSKECRWGTESLVSLERLVISSGRESKARYRSGTESGDCNWMVVISLEELGNSARD
jgi:hypothetical protein